MIPQCGLTHPLRLAGTSAFFGKCCPKTFNKIPKKRLIRIFVSALFAYKVTFYMFFMDL